MKEFVIVFILLLVHNNEASIRNHNSTESGTSGKDGYNNNNDGSFDPNSMPNSGASNNNNGRGGRQAYEFFAFLLWYLLLVLCCLIPTCCAYRRRRQLEARLSQQQENLDDLQQQNLIFLNNLTQRQNANEALWREQRCQLVSKAVEETTMIVQEKDIEQRRGCDNSRCSRASGSARTDEVETSAARSFGTGAIIDEETTATLKLPDDVPNGNRTVPAACAICLTAYEARDRVTWSPTPTCQHAFHQQCIITWLSNKSECPCCRQEFYALPTVFGPNSTPSNGNRLAWNSLQPLELRPGLPAATTTASNQEVVVASNASSMNAHDSTNQTTPEEQLEEGIISQANRTAEPEVAAITDTSPESSTSSEQVGVSITDRVYVADIESGANSETTASATTVPPNNVLHSADSEGGPRPAQSTIDGQSESSATPINL